jgi:glycosyltransferase involved in cell wall biosynthesis
VTADPLAVTVDRSEGTARPLVVFLGKARLGDDRSPAFARRAAMIDRHVRPVWVKTGRSGVLRRGDRLFVTMPALRPPLLGGVLFYTVGPAIAVGIAVARRPSAIICQSPLEGVGVTALVRTVPRRFRPLVQIEVHGDWRTAPRLYGSRARRVLAPLSDRLCAGVIRRADRLRVVSKAMEQAVRATGSTSPIDHYLEFSDYSAFLADPPSPLPPAPRVAFVGVLERYKGVDTLLAAWPSVVDRVPGAELVVVGRGTLNGALHRMAERLALNGSVRFVGQLEPPDLRRVLDESFCLVLPSRSEGMGRVVLEAMARGRPVVASSVGGLKEIVDDGRSGLLVEPDDRAGLADALVDMLCDDERTRRMGLEGRRQVLARDPLSEYEAGIVRVAEWVQEGTQ